MIAIYFKRVLKQNFIYFSFSISLLMLCFSSAIVYVHFATAPGTNIILNLSEHRNQVVNGSINDLYAFIVLGLIFIITNYFIVKELLLKNIYLAYVVTIGSIFLSLLILFDVNAIIKLN